MDRQNLFFNGINGESGTYDIPPLSSEEFSRIIQGEKPAENLAELKARYQQRIESHFAVRESMDPDNLAEAGWGVIFSSDADPQIREALRPLLDLRQSQAGRYFRVFEQKTGYHPRMTRADFLAHNGSGPGPADPEKIPYHLLIVGSPEQIPFSFQIQMDVQYSAGRIDFETIQEYANYAASVVAAETGKVRLARQAAIFGVQNQDDAATGLANQNLLLPLIDFLSADQPDWQVTAYLNEEATHRQMDALLGGDPARTPTFLFGSAHGMTFPDGSPRQLSHQGALLCQDWPGPRSWKGPIPEDYYFAGDHLPSDRNLLGMIAFLFAGYSGGTPQVDSFEKQYFQKRSAKAPRSFVARLPMRMLGLPRGALAVVAHIDRAWGFPLDMRTNAAATFEFGLQALLSGKTVGSAMEYFNERYAEVSTTLSELLEEIEFGMQYDPSELVSQWIANNDARNYAVLGDPAVRLPVAGQDEPVLERSAVNVVEQVSVTLDSEKEAVQPAMAEPVMESTRPADEEARAVSSEPPAENQLAEPAFPSLSKGSSMGILTSANDTYAKMAEEIRTFSSRLLAMLNESVDESSVIHVKTFLKEQLVAVTELRLNGDVSLMLNVEPEELDANLLSLHTQMVQQARAGQAEMLKAMTESVARLTGTGK